MNDDGLPAGELASIADPRVIDYYVEMCERIWEGLLPRPRTASVRPVYGHLCLNALAACLARAGILGKELADDPRHREQLKVFLLRTMAQWLREHPAAEGPD